MIQTPLNSTVQCDEPEMICDTQGNLGDRREQRQEGSTPKHSSQAVEYPL